MATKQAEAAAKAARFQKATKEPLMVSAAPLSLEWSNSASVIGTAEGSTNSRRADPCAELLAATERNAQEAREEREKAEKEKADAAKAASEEDDAAAKAQADAAAKAQADAAAKAQAEEAAHGRAPQLIIPLRFVPPAPEMSATTGGVGDKQTDYHNIRAAAFNSHIQELAKRNADLVESRGEAFGASRYSGGVSKESSSGAEQGF
nr:translation initiation factor IF-2-like [Aegilops tauschii subsp. strangulata]